MHGGHWCIVIVHRARILLRILARKVSRVLHRHGRTGMMLHHPDIGVHGHHVAPTPAESVEWCLLHSVLKSISNVIAA